MPKQLSLVLDARHFVFEVWISAYGAIGRMEVILNSFVEVPTVIEINFGVIFVTLNGPFHLRAGSLHTQTCSPGEVSYLVAGGSLHFKVLQTHFSAIMISISNLVFFRASNHPVCLGDFKLGHGVHVNTPKMRSDETRPSGPMVSSKSLMLSLKTCSSVNLCSKGGVENAS